LRRSLVPASYAEFLARRTQANEGDGFEPGWMPDYLYAFQRELVTWAIEMGRAALFEDCGLGKTPQSLVWAENVVAHTGKPVLVVTPLAVTPQVEQEAQKFGIEAAASRKGSTPARITVTNYERLHHFDPLRFGGVVCDESSAIKAFDSQRRAVVTEFLRTMRYRLLATATAAPNDYTELGTSSEALGCLGHMDMLNRFFTNDQKTSKTNRLWTGAQWRFKGHAEEGFWRWVSSWARAIRRPSDLGYPDIGFDLPPLYQHEHVIEAETAPEDRLFAVEAHGLREERDELRRTIDERCEAAAALLQGSEPGIAWCNLNDESERLGKLIDGAVELRGSDHVDEKEEKLIAFTRGEIRVLVTKAQIAGWGLNWQHCNRMTFFPSHSYEQMYQAVRRCWRFGQEKPVTVDLITTNAGMQTLKNVRRKAAQAERMFEALTRHMREAQSLRRDDSHNHDMEIPAWCLA
jgi:hypothetical protein